MKIDGIHLLVNGFRTDHLRFDKIVKLKILWSDHVALEFPEEYVVPCIIAIQDLCFIK